MRRVKRHKIKNETPETSATLARDKEEHDLAYYIHDRVELMHQVFSCLKYRELKAMAPECVRHISVDNLQELCTEELLGISSKRLCAILDGAEPPSDTESSSSQSPDNLETISLDSISSDEEILSQDSSKKSKKHKHRRGSKSKSKRKKSKEQDVDEDADKSRASRAGLTVLELLELQARARAIRAQLQQEQQKKPQSESAAPDSSHSSDGEVEIKEEPAEVVEISSEDEKPKIEELEKQKLPDAVPTEKPTTVTKRINDLVITVPQTKPTRKIKLNRTKVASAQPATNVATPKVSVTIVNPTATSTEVKKDKFKKKKKSKQKKVDKEGSDHDEITLQLSDSEKIDLLEDLDRKSYENVTSMDDESSSDSDSDSSINNKINKDNTTNRTVSSDGNAEISIKNIEITTKDDCLNETNITTNAVVESIDSSETTHNNVDQTIINTDLCKTATQVTANEEVDAVNIQTKSSQPEKVPIDNKIDSNTDKSLCDTGPSITDSSNEMTNVETAKHSIDTVNINVDNVATPEDAINTNKTVTNMIEVSKIDDIPILEDDNKKESSIEIKLTEDKETGDTNKNVAEVRPREKELSEGEISDKESSEVEAVDLKPDVVCISDEELDKSRKKKKKKEKKSKKDKKSKKKDFRESADQNFYKETLNEDNALNKTNLPSDVSTINNKDEARDKQSSDIDTIDLDEVYEILELSDDSSCYEVEGTVLSKEPTADEIEALSAKIDEIERVEVITAEEIREYETEKDKVEVENISWKDRYLDSTKVKKVLTTSNILNALRKKNIELKKKIAESKETQTEPETPTIDNEEKDTNEVIEGTIDQYNTLQGSTKYVDPVKEQKEETLTKEMKKDAKQLLKMYKRLLKYNDINKKKDPNKKKKKKKEKKNVDKD